MSNSKRERKAYKQNTNIRGRNYIPAHSLSNDLRTLIITSIEENGGNVLTGEIPYGILSQVADRLKVANSTVRKVWDQNCCYGTVDPLPHVGGRQPILADHDVQYVEFLKREKPSITQNEIKQKLMQNANVNISCATVGRTITYRLSEEKWTYKKMVRPSKERFTVPNLMYTQAYIDVLHQADPYKLKFFDESGFKLPDVGNPVYGHAPISEKAVEIQNRCQTKNMTLNLVVGLNGLYADVINGASNTQNYLEFWDDAATYGQNFDASPILSAGDMVVVDNCPTHRNAGGRALAHFLHNMGIEYVFTPSYSPDLNVAELVFGKLKCLMHNEPYQSICKANMEYAIFSALQEITISDIRGFFKKVGYLNI